MSASEPTEEEKAILDAPPRGTWALLVGMMVLFVVGWGYFYFGLFLSHGPVN